MIIEIKALVGRVIHTFEFEVFTDDEGFYVVLDGDRVLSSGKTDLEEALKKAISKVVKMSHSILN